MVTTAPLVLAEAEGRLFLDAAFEGVISPPADDYDPAEVPAEEAPDYEGLLDLNDHGIEAFVLDMIGGNR